MPSIRLHESETIVSYGHRKVVWFVRAKDHFMPAATWPNALIEERDPGPGTTWERYVEVTLEPGSILMQVDSRPTGRPARDVLDYLQRETRHAERDTLRSYYRVDSTGRLVRSEPKASKRQRPQTQKGSGPRRG